ncbi:hypothetical protein NCAS_0A11990 [Naumovozyma castellii]|uniref:Importin N-terminal domain-containing protein n=1 Tax=Naumovozyma castellii TaxID=27288 RepID=G0V8F9_NAUCA|nr:hypothetical protein NCAS_0A11990 [Naumovozyma castellii CBS 4309]CCC67757.1 hypothetical protein NCAS_0A11990 [Naumovozyma castellii CBS 4309]
MSNSQAIVACIEHTMVSDANVIKEAERQLQEYQKEDGFTSFLLTLITNDDTPSTIRLSAAIYFKNKVIRSWNAKRDDGIKPAEQQAIKDNLIQALIKFAEDNHIRPHITEAIKGILDNNDHWDLIEIITKMLTSGQQDYLYPGILLLFTVCRVHRWDMADERDYIDKVALNVFPIIEESSSQLVNATDYRSSELLYLILKSFKYACLSNFPAYFKNVEKLSAWIQLHLYVCAKPLPQEVMDLEPSDRSLDKRVKVTKWGFGNLNKFIHRYAKSTKLVSEEFITYVFENLVPTILEQYFKVIEAWSDRSLWLSDASLFYLIEFLNKCMITVKLYPLLNPHIMTIIKSIILPCLDANEESVELWEDDQEEYTRRYYDTMRDTTSADKAAVDFIFAMGAHQDNHLQELLHYLNGILTEFSQNTDDVKMAYRQEGAMRGLSTLFEQMNEKTEIDNVFGTFILALLSQDKYPFLCARALNTVALYTNSLDDMGVLSKIFEVTYSQFLTSDFIPIQVQGADALKTLIICNESIHSSISSQVPLIMERLLKLSKSFETDVYPEVMEAFVERFSDELTPFAAELANNLVEQFLRLDQSIIENNGGSYSTGDPDLEIQAASILQTMSTMVMSMSKVSLIDNFAPVVKFLQLNAQMAFQMELVELMDSLALSSKMLHGEFTPAIWDAFNDLLDAFQTYAAEYFEGYSVFFETVILYGFPTDSTFVEPFLSILASQLDSKIDYNIESVIQLLTYYGLTLRDTPLFDKCIEVSADESLEIDERGMVKLTLANIISKPIETLQTCENTGYTLKFLNDWFDSKFLSVFGIKLQIMAIITLLTLPELPSCVNGFVGQFSSKLITLAQSLPAAIRNRDAMTKGEEFEGLMDPAEEDEYFLDYDDDAKETVLDQVNAFHELHKFFQQIPSISPDRYQQIMSALNNDQKEFLEEALKFVAEH